MKNCGDCGAELADGELDCGYRKGKTVKEVLDERQAKAEQGNWIPASGGTEVPFPTRSGRRLLYCYQPTTGKHAYLDCGTDIILTDEEAQLALALS